MQAPESQVLAGKKALVVGIANEHSIAYGCAKAFRAVGAELALTYLNDKARPFVEPLAKDLGAGIFLPLDVQRAGQLEAVFAATATYLLPARHFVSFSQVIIYRGGGINAVWLKYLMVAAVGMVFFVYSLEMFRKSMAVRK